MFILSYHIFVLSQRGQLLELWQSILKVSRAVNLTLLYINPGAVIPAPYPVVGSNRQVRGRLSQARNDNQRKGTFESRDDRKVEELIRSIWEASLLPIGSRPSIWRPSPRPRGNEYHGPRHCGIFHTPEGRQDSNIGPEFCSGYRDR